MISDCSSRFSSDWRSERIPMVTLSKSISSAALGAWAGGSLCGRARWACGCAILWLCVAPGALGAGPPRAWPSNGRERGGGGGGNERRGARGGAPQVRRQVGGAESCYGSPVKVVRGGNSGEVARFISARLLRAPADPPGWPGAAGLTDAVPALPHHECLENKQLARKGTGRLYGCPAPAGGVTFCYETAFGIRSE